MSLRVLNLSEIITMARVKAAEEDSSNTAWDNATFLLQMANQSVEDISLAWPFFWTEAEAILTTVCNTTTDTSSSTTINAPSTGFSPGVVGWINDGANYERFVCASITDSTITPETALSNSYASGSYVTKEYYDLPADFFQPYTARNIEAGEVSRLKWRRTQAFDLNDPDQGVAGTPKDYLRWGFSTLREPRTAGTYYTSDATTSTTQLVDTSPTSQETNYYRDWLLVNKAMKLQQRISASAYAAGSTTFTMRHPITGQATGQDYFLQKYLMQVFFDVLMDQARDLRFRYYAFPEPLVNDWDVPALPGTCHIHVVHRLLAHMLAQDGKEGRADYYFNMSAKGIQQAIGLFGNKAGMELESMEVASDGTGRTSDSRF